MRSPPGPWIVSVNGSTVEKLDLRTEQTRSIDPTAAYPDQWRSVWTLPLAFSHRDPHVLYFGNQFLYKTTNGGESWTQMGQDLTREDPGVPPNLNDAAAAGRVDGERVAVGVLEAREIARGDRALRHRERDR